MSFPVTRLRRLRRSGAMRGLVRETALRREELVQPLFAVEGAGIREPIAAMPGQFRFSVDRLAEECKEIADCGVPAVLLFGVPNHKDARGSGADAADGIAQRAHAAIKKHAPGLLAIADVCLCEYTDHGHCGLVENERVLNDETLPRLASAALSLARAGADIIAPSDMMDGRVGAIRAGLDGHGFAETPILSYAAKFASAWFGPFREAAGSAPAFGDRRSYQMDPPNRREALREMRLDLEEGADMLMVKPALAYLDVLAEARRSFDVPLAAYQVSGEYAMLRAAAAQGWLDGERAVWESLIGIKRAGADLIISYFAKEWAQKLR
ncbi:MAG: porphobilinogen synthase [Deltaproteobacteria bacterium]|nr:porphobilinogen synthase [Deltaproteobacteria bacterium]MDD9853783.1 porphobilinogen synthase [Deltaproteobacteria bacterium]